MATSVYPATGGFSDTTTQANFIPELWSDEIKAAYEKQRKLRLQFRQIPKAKYKS